MTPRSILITVGASSALLSAVPAACGGNGNKAGFSSSTHDASVVQTAAGDAAGGVAPAPGQPVAAQTADSGSAAIPTSGTNTAFVRLAVWAPDAPAGGYDVCVMPQGNGSAWMGPLLGTALTFPSVGRYVPIPPGSYNVGIMAAGTGCGAPVNGVIPLGMIPANARGTIAIVGDISPSGNDQPAKIVVFADDVIGPASQAAVRFIDALPGAQNVIIGTGSVTNFSFVPLTGSVPFAGVSSSPADGGAADNAGYLMLPPIVGASLSAHVPQGETDISTSTSFGSGGLTNGGAPGILSSADDLATGTGASWGAGTAVTVALVRSTTTGSAQFLVCQDDAPPMAALSACTALSK
jgi:hypothetical protein